MLLDHPVSVGMSEQWECEATRGHEDLLVKMEFVGKTVSQVKWDRPEKLVHVDRTLCGACLNKYYLDQREKKVNLAMQVHEVDREFQGHPVIQVRRAIQVSQEKMVLLGLKDREDGMV